MKFIFIIILSMFYFLSSALANEDALREKIEKAYPEITISSVVKTKFNNLYEVLIGDQIIYTDEKFSFLIIGKVVDPNTRKDLTQARVDELTKVDFNSLPFDQSIKIVKGDGSKKLAVFSDVDCPFCKKLEREALKELNDATIYIFLYPLDIHPDAKPKSAKIWCAKNRAEAWLDFMLNNKMVENDGNCKTPITETLALGRSLGITATPTIILSTGKRVPGALSFEELDKFLKGFYD